MKIFTRNIGAMPRCREGPPKRGHLRLGEPEDSKDEHFGKPRWSKPLLLGGHRLRLGIPAMV